LWLFTPFKDTSLLAGRYHTPVLAATYQKSKVEIPGLSFGFPRCLPKPWGPDLRRHGGSRM
jgi:hypothetical protein